MELGKGGFGDQMGAKLVMRPLITDLAGLHGNWGVRCIGPDGKLKWEEPFKNYVVNEGKQKVLETVLKLQSVGVLNWWVGLLEGPDTGWHRPIDHDWTVADLTTANGTLFVDYSEGNNQQWVGGSVTLVGGSPPTTATVDNSASTANFTISANASTIAGAFLVSTNVKNPPSGSLYAVGKFVTGDKPANQNDTLQVTATFTATSP